MSKCNSCSAEIIWATTEQGAKMPLDAVPTATGNVQLVADRAYVLSIGQISVLTNEEKAGLRETHFATCPNAGRHRSKKPTA